MALDWTFEMTPEFARAAAPPLERALWAVSERLLAQRMRTRLRYRDRIRVGGVILCVIGVVLALYAFWITSVWRFVAYASVFIALMIVFALLQPITDALRRFARRMVALRARKTMERIARAAPYTALYHLDGTQLSATVGKMKWSAQLDLRTVKTVVPEEQMVVAFGARRQVRVLYVAGAAERTALLDALAAAGAELVTP